VDVSDWQGPKANVYRPTVRIYIAVEWGAPSASRGRSKLARVRDPAHPRRFPTVLRWARFAIHALTEATVNGTR